MRLDAGALSIVDACVLYAAGFAAIAACLLRARRAQRGHRAAWILLALAAISELTGRWLWWEHTPRGMPLHLPSTGPVLHVVAATLAAAAVIRLRARTVDRAATRRTMLDALTVLVAVVLVTSSAVFANGNGASAAARECAGMATAADVMLAVIGLVVLSCARYPGGAGLRSLLPVCAGLVAVAAGDAGVTGVALSGGISGGTPADFLIAGGLLLLMAGALVGEEVDGVAAMPRRERIAVCAAVGPVVLAALAVAGYQLTEGRLPASVALSVMGLSGLLLLRLIVALLDNLVLSRTLESQVVERTLELVTREQWFRSLVQHSSDVVSVVDEFGVIRYQSPAVERLFGYDPAATIGAPVTSMLRPEDVGLLQMALARAVGLPGKSFVLEFPVAHSDGTWRDTETVVTSLLDVPDVRGLVLNTRDVTERRQLQERLTHQAYYDALTGLANRSLFQRDLAAALPGAPAGSVAVLFCDLDGFKAINDSQGHDVGDALLGIVADRLRRCVRPMDLVARFGGDEFAVLVRDVDAMTSARDIADRMAQSLEAPVGLDGRELRIGVSIGIAGVAPDADSVDVLLRNADLAMYRAKSRRDQSFVRFEAQMHDALLARMKAESDLRQAVTRGDLVMYYQPVVELSSRTVIGVEALVRWKHHERGIISPADFIDLAEETGLVGEIGRWALEESCKQGARWQKHAAPGGHFKMAVNVSARQFDATLPRQVRDILSSTGLPGPALTLEMTESVLMERTDEVVELLRRMKTLGLKVAVDDFGTGYSSLSYLSRFPVDILKIDKSFVQHIGNDSGKGELVHTIVRLGESLRLDTVAEGIETTAQRDALTEMGCTFGQGYLFARPLPPADIDVLLEEQSRARIAV